MARDDDDLTIARLCLELGRPREALRILSDRPSDPATEADSARLRARAHLAVREFRAAREWATRATTLEPASAWGWRLLAAAASRTGDRDVALPAATRAIELEPTSWLSHAQRVEVDLAGGRRAVTEETWDAAHEAMRLAPEEPAPFLLGGHLAHSRGFLDGAETLYREALRIDPDNQVAKQRLALLRLDGNDMAGATTAFLDLVAEDDLSTRHASGLRRAVLRTLEWVNGILLVSLILVALLAILEASTPSTVVADHIVLVGILVLTVGGLGFAWSRYRRGLGDRGIDLLRRLPAISRSLVLLASMQAVVLVATVVVILLLVAPSPGWARS